MENKWAIPSLILGVASVAVFTVNALLPAILGGAAAVMGSFGIRQDTKRVVSLIGMALGFLTFVFSGYSVGF
jgi:uncharacterized membrane protein